MIYAQVVREILRIPSGQLK